MRVTSRKKTICLVMVFSLLAVGIPCLEVKETQCYERKDDYVILTKEDKGDKVERMLYSAQSECWMMTIKRH